MFDIFGPSLGIATHPSQLRALSKSEIEAIQQSDLNSLVASQNNSHTAFMAWAMQNWNPVPERPLDERFADLKKRLESALVRHPSARLPVGKPND